jgi:LPXTG-motif cell wall-anchored protein
MYQAILPAGLIVPATVVLPKTGDNTLLAVTAVVSILVGLTIIVTSVARMVAKRAQNKA